MSARGHTAPLRGAVAGTYRGLQDRRRVSQAVILVTFLVVFGAVRAITHLQRAGVLPNQQGGLHIHHMVPGIILLLVSGYVGLSFWSSERLRWITAALFGAGAALTLDEFALWLFLQDVYWARQGRDSVDAVIIGVALMTMVFLISEAHDHAWVKATGSFCMPRRHRPRPGSADQ